MAMSNGIPFRVTAIEVAVVCGALAGKSAAHAGPTSPHVNAEARRIVPHIPEGRYEDFVNRIVKALGG